MALPLAEAFTARSLGVMWNNYQKTLGAAPYLGRQKFGTRKQESLDLRFIKGKSGLPVSLKASNFDAQAELRDVGGFSDVHNSMPFYRESYMVTEKEEQEYDNYRSAENSSLANNVLREISKKPMNLIEGVDYTDNEGAEHKKQHFKSISGTSAWDKPATATPLDDLIQTRRDFAKATGYSLTRFTMNTETWEMVLKAEDTKKQVLGITAYNGGIRLQQVQVAEYLRGYGIEIEVYDKLYIDENGKSQYFVPTGIVSAQSSGVFLGDYVFGKTPEERSGSLTDGNLSLVETGVSICYKSSD